MQGKGLQSVEVVVTLGGEPFVFVDGEVFSLDQRLLLDVSFELVKNV